METQCCSQIFGAAVAAPVCPPRPEAAARPGVDDGAVTARGFSVFYRAKEAVRKVDLQIPSGQVTAIIGPSGCGKSTLLRAINRMNDLVPGCRTGGELVYRGQNLYSPEVDVVALRRRIGMVFQKPNPFPKSVFDNVAYGPRLHGRPGRGELEELVERVGDAAGKKSCRLVDDRLADTGVDRGGKCHVSLLGCRDLIAAPHHSPFAPRPGRAAERWPLGGIMPVSDVRRGAIGEPRGQGAVRSKIASPLENTSKRTRVANRFLKPTAIWSTQRCANPS